MIPSFVCLKGGLAGTPVQVPPPPGFRAPLLPIKQARFGSYLRSPPGVSAAQRAGLRYESKVSAALQERHNKLYRTSQVVHYEDQRGDEFAIPDGMLFISDAVTIVEIKSQHMPESWWQLRRKYEPIVRKAVPQHKILLVEICRSLDASMPYPEPFEQIADLEVWISRAHDGMLGVFQWKL